MTSLSKKSVATVGAGNSPLLKDKRKLNLFGASGGQLLNDFSTLDEESCEMPPSFHYNSYGGGSRISNFTKNENINVIENSSHLGLYNDLATSPVKDSRMF